MAKRKGVSESAQAAIKKSFSLDKFKKNKGLANTSIKFKEQRWIPLSKAFQEITSIPGIPEGHITLLRGHSDTGKTTALLEAAVAAQKMGILPVFIITEMKWSWEHAREMGLDFQEVVDESTGEIVDYEGFFIYTDRGQMNTIEDVAAFILDLIDDQRKAIYLITFVSSGILSVQYHVIYQYVLIRTTTNGMPVLCLHSLVIT